uniref:NADH dehydrogenase subunit 4L n=1 Tax=Cichlidogyrus mbirizei TaxID=2094302 RepID=A0A344ANV2_9PLAT|nr:NADH dehydrogenase subunit 4L [Cichlidogyrus mbirizei]
MSVFAWILLLLFLVILGCFSSARASFISLVIFLEVINVLVLLLSFLLGSFIGSFLYFLAFIVVATMEVVLSLVSLTRLWCLDMFVY